MHRLRQEWLRVCSSSLAQNAGWMLFGQGLSIFCQGVYFILLARLLGPVEYGIYVGIVAMVAIVSQYSSFGSPAVLLQYVSPDPKKFAPYWGIVLAVTTVGGGLLVVFLTLAVPHLARAYSWPMVLCVAVGDCVCAQLTLGAGRVFQAFEKMRTTAFLNLIVNLLRMLIAGTMFCTLRHGTARQWIVAALVVSSIGTCIALILVTRRYGKPSFSLPLLRRRAGQSFVYTLSASTTNIYNDFDKAMLGHYGMNAANGIYTMAYRTIDICTTPIASVHSAAFPRFFCKGTVGVRNTAAYAKRILKRTAPLGLLLGACAFVVAPLVPYILGRGFKESVLALRWLCLLPLLRSFQLSAGDALTGAGFQSWRLMSQGTAAVFNFTVNLFLIPRFGWYGAAWSSLATDGLLAAMNWMILAALQKGAQSE